MSSEIIKAADGFIPDVWAGLIQGEFKNKVRVAPLAVNIEGLEGQPGETITLPKWGTLKDLSELTEAEPITTQTLGQTATQATIKEYGTAVEWTDKRALTGLGDLAGEVTRQLGVLAARNLDAELIKCAAAETGSGTTGKNVQSKPLALDVSSSTKNLSWDVIVDGIAKFGDAWEPSDFAGLLIRSDMQAMLMKDSTFIKAADLGRDTTVTTGQIGVLAGLPVIVTDRLPEHQFLMLKRGALGVAYKRRPVLEHDRDILKRTHVVTMNVHYAVKRLKDNGVLVGKLQA